MLSGIDAATVPGTTVWDRGEKASVTGLHLRVNKDGSKTFFIYYRTRAGRERRPKIGIYGHITLPEARKRASQLLHKVALGEDPKGQWDAKKAEMTVEQLFNQCYAEHWAKLRYVESGWAYEAKRLYTKNLSLSFGSLKISEVTPGLVRNWHSRLEAKPYAGNRGLNVLSKLFQYAEERELKPQHTNPCALVKAHPERKRSRFASEEEIAKIAPILAEEAALWPAAGAFLYLLIYTGSRPSAIARATWDQLEEVETNGQIYGVLRFKGKTSNDSGEKEQVILPPQVMSVIQKLPRIEGETITGLDNLPRRIWNRIREKAGCEDLWARDWRRTFATVGMGDNVSMDTIGELLNHKSRQTTKTYAKLVPTKQVQAVAQIANRMQALMGGKQIETL